MSIARPSATAVAKRGAHDAMDALVAGINARKVNWILDADIEKFLYTAS